MQNGWHFLHLGVIDIIKLMGMVQIPTPIKQPPSN